MSTNRRAIRRMACTFALISSLSGQAVSAHYDQQVDGLKFYPVPLTEAGSLALSSLPGSQPAGKHFPAGRKLALPYPGWRQDNPDSRQRMTLSAYQESLQSTQQREGPLAFNLVEDLLAVARIRQSLGEHRQALALLDRAQHTVRVNEGLASLSQLPIIAMRVDSLNALQQFSDVGAAYEQQLNILAQHYGAGHVETVPGLQALAGWHLDVFRRGMDYGGDSDRKPFDVSASATEHEVRQQAFDHLETGQQRVLDAIRLLVKAEAHDDPRLKSLEETLIETYFLMGYRDEIISDPSNFLARHQRPGDSIRPRDVSESAEKTRAYNLGRNSFARVLNAMQETPQTTSLVDYADVVVSLADWSLLFQRREEAFRHYSKAETLLKAAEAGPNTVADRMSPKVPVLIPGFIDASYSAVDRNESLPASRSFRGYVDLTFDVNRFGRSLNVTADGRSENTSEEIVDHLTRMVSNAHFRPRFVNGEAVYETYQVRYFY